VKADDPRLTVREVQTPRQPLRVVIDSQVETPLQARILQGERALVFAAVAGKTLPNAEIVVMPNASGKVDLAKMLQELARRGVNELHVEGGFKLNGSLVREGCVDEFLIYLNPSLLGDSAQGTVNLAEMVSLDQRVALKLRSVERIGDDLRIIARP
jgi:diaminohydroxyphosphoribosylaminopyrimidine deaminase/5-amino-6-(5-phosphoribosylamino)uracil reductase